VGLEEVAESYVKEDSLNEELGKWLAEIEPYRFRQPERIVPERIALIVVDMTKPFVDSDRPLASPNSQVIVPRVGQLAETFRQAARPVLWVVQGHHSVAHDRGDHLASWWPLPLLEGTEDVEMAEGLEVRPGEKVIVKRRYSGFYQTDLELTLRNLGISQIVICGVLTNVCPYATAFDAFVRDFLVYYPADCTASLNRELHVTALKNIATWCGHVVPSREIISQLTDSRLASSHN
jgi:ureidoacrylate peracid hydrolase